MVTCKTYQSSRSARPKLPGTHCYRIRRVACQHGNRHVVVSSEIPPSHCAQPDRKSCEYDADSDSEKRPDFSQERRLMIDLRAAHSMQIARRLRSRASMQGDVGTRKVITFQRPANTYTLLESRPEEQLVGHYSRCHRRWSLLD